MGTVKEKSVPLFHKAEEVVDGDIPDWGSVKKENESRTSSPAAVYQVEAKWICNKMSQQTRSLFSRQVNFYNQSVFVGLWSLLHLEHIHLRIQDNT